MAWLVENKNGTFRQLSIKKCNKLYGKKASNTLINNVLVKMFSKGLGAAEYGSGQCFPLDPDLHSQPSLECLHVQMTPHTHTHTMGSGLLMLPPDFLQTQRHDFTSKSYLLVNISKFSHLWCFLWLWKGLHLEVGCLNCWEETPAENAVLG